MIIGKLCLDPTGACDIQTALVDRIRKADFSIDPPPSVSADKRPPMDSGRYIVVKVSQLGLPTLNGSAVTFQISVILSCFIAETKLSRNDAVDVLDTAQLAALGPGVTQKEEFCLLQGLPIVTTIRDGGFMGQVTMRATVARERKCL